MNEEHALALTFRDEALCRRERTGERQKYVFV